MSNFALSARFKKSLTSENLATWSGTIKKIITLMLVLCLSAFVGCTCAAIAPVISVGLALILIFVVLGLGYALYKYPEKSESIAAAYAVCEGFCLGVIATAVPAKGIVATAIFTTILCSMLTILTWKKGWITVTNKIKNRVAYALGLILAVYIIDIFIRIIFGASLIFGHGLISIIISLVICVVAVFTLLVDFQTIDEALKEGLPAYYEWYFGVSILITIVWLYLEITRLVKEIYFELSD